MTQVQKQLLLKDLCVRLPYGVKFQGEDFNVYTLDAVNYFALQVMDVVIKPYLRPMSSMTKEDMDKLNRYIGGDRFIFEDEVISVDKNFYHEGRLYSDHEDYVNIIDWLNSHHFDYRGLIEEGLALEAKEGMY